MRDPAVVIIIGENGRNTADRPENRYQYKRMALALSKKKPV